MCSNCSNNTNVSYSDRMLKLLFTDAGNGRFPCTPTDALCADPHTLL